MVVRREHKQTDLERRMKILNQQLYGKLEVSKEGRVSRVSNRDTKLTFDTLDTPKPLGTHTDVLYLKRDLLKITLLSILAFGAQFALYFALQNNYIKLPF